MTKDKSYETPPAQQILELEEIQQRDIAHQDDQRSTATHARRLPAVTPAEKIAIVLTIAVTATVAISVFYDPRRKNHHPD